MNSILKRHLFAIACALILYSCGGPGHGDLFVVSELPRGVVEDNYVIKVNFSRGVVKQDSVNIWTNSPFIEFKPAITGKFVWKDTATLVFSPDYLLPGDAKFKGKLNKDLLLKVSGANSFYGDYEFEFSTESFRLSQAEFFYDRLDEKKTVGVKANLEFTYAVNPADLRKYLKISIDDNKVGAVKVHAENNSRIISIEISEVKQINKPRKVKIEFDENLYSTETKTRIKVEKPFVFDLPALGDLAIYGHEFLYLEAESRVKIRTSQEVDLSAAKKYITIEPRIDFSIEGDRQNLYIKGKFQSGVNYAFKLKKGMPSVIAGSLQNDYIADIVFGDVDPSFKFGSANGVYMLLGGDRKIVVKTINLSKLVVKVSQIFQNNLVHFLNEGRYYDWDYYYDYESGDYSYTRKYRYRVDNYGRLIERKEIEIKGTTNKETETYVDLSPYMNEGYKGFYLIEIANPEEEWRSTSKLVSVSNIGMIVKKSDDEVNVYAVSLLDNEPIKNCQISLFSSNNQIIASQKTDGDGVASFKDYLTLQKDFYLKLAVAEIEGDFNFINLEDYLVDNSRYDVGGKRDALNSLDAYIYGDRNLYRPGEKIFVSCLIRNFNGELTAQLPVKIKIYNPSGNLISEMKRTLNEEGSFEIEYQTLQSDMTGQYRFDLFTGNDIYLNTYRISLEDFVPDRLKINLKPNVDKAETGEHVRFELEALNFFGPPASGRNWEFESTFDPFPFKSKKFPEFNFIDYSVSTNYYDPIILSGQTDDNGKANVSCYIPNNLQSSGIINMRAKTAVFDETGRPVYQYSQIEVYPKKYYIGILNKTNYYVSPNTNQRVRIIAVDKYDNPINGFKAKIELIRKEWHSVLRRSGANNALRYVSEQRDITVKTETITLGSSPYEYSFSVPRSGDYVLKVSKQGESGYNQIWFYSYSWATSDAASFEIDPEAKVDIILDKKSYSPGDKAKVLFQTPFDGKMLVTVERNKVYEHRYVDVKNNSASIELSVKNEYLPNVYISAVLFRKVKDQDIPLMAGHGFVPFMVEDKSNKLNVQIFAPERIRPKRKQKITINTGEKYAYLTLAAVDEGICQVKNYKTPDPYNYFYAKKSLTTLTYDFFKDLIQEPVKATSKSVGGDADEQMEYRKRVNPLGVQRFKPLAIWSGIIKTDSDGKAEITLDIPEFSGELRLMAFAYKGKRFGSSQKGMKISDPIVINASIPRFLSSNDSLVMSITAFNTTDRKADLQFNIETGGTVYAPNRTANLSVDANQERYVETIIKAKNQIGAGNIKISTSAFGEKIESFIELPVRSVSPFISESFSGFVEGGNSVNQYIDDKYMTFGRKAYVALSPFPVVNFAKRLKYLVGYPHGCLEQTVSKAFPQLYLRDIAAVLDPNMKTGGSPGYFVNEAISKLSSMQNYDGSFVYWPGGNYSNDWTTVYATHFLIEAQKAGYDVREKTLNSALNSLQKIARGKKVYDYVFYEGNRRKIKRIADKSVIYALYVLSLAKKQEIAMMNYYRVEKSMLTLDSKYLLAAAFMLSGDRRTYLELLPKQFSAEESERTDGYNFESPIRANALILNLLLETDLNNPNIPTYMEYLSSLYAKDNWFSTQDDAFTLLAFGKAARLAAGGRLEAVVKVNGKEFKYKGGTVKYDIDPFGKNVAISASGSGRLYYSIIVEGIRTDGRIRIEDRNLQVRREFYNRMGQRIDLNSIKQNDLIIVKVNIRSSAEYLENVAITDMLPAGFEIENPRLIESSKYSFTQDAAYPKYLDIRDDRINIYTNFNGRREQNFYYMARAVSRGVFDYAPIVAEAMYSPNYYSAHGRTRTIITK